MDIKELRKSKNLTQREFAEAIGVNQSTMAGIETGRRKLSEEMIAKIRELYGVEVEATVKATKAVKASDKAAKAGRAAAAAKKKGIIIQSPMGGEITPDEILSKIAAATKGERVGTPDVVYIRVDENKAFWVKGKKNGAIDLW